MSYLSIVEDFKATIEDLGFTEEFVSQQSRYEGDVIQASGSLGPKLEVRDSDIQGKGFFTCNHISKGEPVCICRWGNKRTLAGRYVNHSPDANVQYRNESGNTVAYALRDIRVGEELTVHYKQSLKTSLAPYIEELAIAKARQDSRSDTIDKLEARLMMMPQAESQTIVEFAPGICVRTSIIEAGNLFVTAAHKVDHPFIFSEGHASVWTRQSGWVEFEAVKRGITKAGTRRVVISRTRCVMTTYHPNPKNIQDVDEFSKEVYFPVSMPRSLTAEEIEDIDRFIFVLDNILKTLKPGEKLALPSPEDPLQWATLTD